jgi:hypothetical protein
MAGFLHLGGFDCRGGVRTVSEKTMAANVRETDQMLMQNPASRRKRASSGAPR